MARAMKTGLIIRHVPYEGVAGFRAPIEAAGYTLERVDVGDPGFDALDLLAPDLLILMGGPMGVYEREAHPWITGEVARIAERIAAGRPTLGICLGSQLIAAAMGAKVYPGPVKEVGFAPVTLTPEGEASPLRHVAGVPVLHWHGDTFDLPDGTERLASTAAYRNQAFRCGRHVLALQCHPEMGEDPRLGAWLEDAAYIASAGTDAVTIRRDEARFGPTTVAAGRAMMAEWLAELG